MKATPSEDDPPGNIAQPSPVPVPAALTVRADQQGPMHLLDCLRELLDERTLGVGHELFNGGRTPTKDTQEWLLSPLVTGTLPREPHSEGEKHATILSLYVPMNDATGLQAARRSYFAMLALHASRGRFCNMYPKLVLRMVECATHLGVKTELATSRFICSLGPEMHAAPSHAIYQNLALYWLHSRANHAAAAWLVAAISNRKRRNDLEFATGEEMADYRMLEHSILDKLLDEIGLPCVRQQVELLNELRREQVELTPRSGVRDERETDPK